MVNTTVDVATTYEDQSVVNGTTYDYFVESVDASGCQSAPSNIVTVNIPTTRMSEVLASSRKSSVGARMEPISE